MSNGIKIVKHRMTTVQRAMSKTSLWEHEITVCGIKGV